MKVSIRDKTYPDGTLRLVCYRPREREYALPADAHQTPSGYWIVWRQGKPIDVATSREEARAMLEAYFDARND